jgi:hypothetical protein
MKSLCKIACGLAASATVALGQVVTPIWVQHLNGSVNVNSTNRLPILVKNVGGTEGGGDGTSSMVSLGKMLRYDSQRYLLMIRENGIIESAAHDTNLANAYPDNSLIWIDANTGAPLGLAHVFGVHPVTVTGQGSQNDYYHEWGIDQDVEGKRALYSGHKNTILRWAPKAGGGWEKTPTCAWVEPTTGATDCAGSPLDESTSGDGNQSIRWREFRVTGAGANTVIFAGGGTWRAGCQPQMFKTKDGLTFRPAARLDDRNNGAPQAGYALGGQISDFVKYGWDATRPNLLTAYSGHFPGTGYGARPDRYQTDLDKPDTTLTHSYAFAADGNVAVMTLDEAATNGIPAFSWQAAGKDGLPEVPTVDGVQYYDGNWSCTLDANASLDYIVNYSMPSWNSQDGGVYGNVNRAKPGWLAVHRLDGSIAPNSAWQLPCTERDIATPDESPGADPIVGNAWGYCGDVTLYPDTTAAANLKAATFAWSGGAYGYVLFKVQNVAATVVTQPADITISENQPLTLTAELSGSPNAYQWSKDAVALDGTRTNADGTLYYPATVVQGVKAPKLFLPMAGLADSGKYKLTAVNPLGNVTTREVQVTVQSDTTSPTIASISPGRSGTGSYLRLEYSEQVTPETAGLATNYKLSSALKVNSAQVVSPTAVMLYTDTLAPSTSYTLTVNGVKDISTKANVIAADTQKTFTGPVLTPGSILWEFWPGIPGSDVESLEADARYPNMPTRTEHMTDWSTDDNGLSGIAETYGSRSSGWITPTQNGSYRFFIASDDSSKLFMNTKGAASDAASVSEIASENGCCNAFLEPTALDPNNNGSKQTSDPIALTAGQSYYLYLEQKEGGGGDWSKVAWRKEGDTTAAASLKPIPGSFVSSYGSAAVSAPKLNPAVFKNGQVTISWTGTAALFESTDLKSWTAVAGNPASPFVVTPSGGAKFYRLQQ